MAMSLEEMLLMLLYELCERVQNLEEDVEMPWQYESVPVDSIKTIPTNG